MIYRFRERINNRNPVEADENGEINIGHTVELLEEILGEESDDIVARCPNAICLQSVLVFVLNGDPWR